MRITFITWDGGGNESPAVGIAQTLLGRGHEVRFAGYPSQASRFAGREIRFTTLANAAAEAAAQPPPRPMPALIMVSPRQVDDVRALIQADQPDLLVIDCLMFGAIVAARQSEAPMAVLVHNAPGLLVPPDGAIERFLLPAINQLEIAAGLPPADRLWDAWGPGPVICTSIAEIDPHATAVPSTFSYVGPVRERHVASGRDALVQPTRSLARGSDRPLVLATFTSSGGWDQHSRVSRTIEGLAEAPVDVLVTNATVDQSLTLASNASLTGFLDHDLILPHVAVTVTHGGHGTAMASLAHGVPIVFLPNAFSDQPSVAARVAELGAGIALDGDAASPAEISVACEQAIRAPSFRAAAARLGAAIAASPGPEGAATILEATA